MKNKFIPVSPAHLIDSIIITLMLLVSIIVIVAFHIATQDLYFLAFYFSWFIFAVCLFAAMGISYRGMIIVKMGTSKIESFLLKKRYCGLHYQDIKHVLLVKSKNYGFDTKAGYIVLSNEPIEGKNLALSFKPTTQIVIRVSSKNYSWIRDSLSPLSIQEYLPDQFKAFQTMVMKYNVNLIKNQDDCFLKVVAKN